MNVFQLVDFNSWGTLIAVDDGLLSLVSGGVEEFALPQNLICGDNVGCYKVNNCPTNLAC